ncbi:hypothetical protein ACFX5U_09890 [Sphingobacterium sp. SG20118]|uniref:hypothetical protein n=1 Tax=Sphingobacterium TaxID=28453 RepID=UPI0004F73C69|nr:MULTISPECIES: hypothetical protein [Sphingobacterium]AIM37134.1 hypothetical protein KO02_10870 [Sphingobacterium sp. ML3W]MDH5826782.1 hypothetical protein [Sphingobacterium faecium]
MRKLTLLSVALSGCMLYACNNTPQEKAKQEMKKTEEKALSAAEDANQASSKLSSKDMETIIYSNMAAANEAITKINMPTLSNHKAKELCSDLGKSIIDRINARDTDDIIDTEKDIVEDRADVSKALLENKITENDKNLILKYADDCIAAARATL